MRSLVCRPKDIVRCSRSAGVLALLVLMPALVAQPPIRVPAGQRTPDVSFVAPLGGSLPVDARFVDDQGREVTLGDCLGGRPGVLALIYYDCPMLCGLTINGLVHSLRDIDLTPGEDYEVILLSIDPEEGPELARAKKESALRRYARPETAAGWHFLTGTEPGIRSVADAAGFRYERVPSNGEYAHAAGVLVLTPAGRISQAHYGVEYVPRDLRLGLVEASAGEIGSATDALLLLCYAWDPAQGKYGFQVMAALRIGAGLTLAAIAGIIGTSLLRDRRVRRREGAGRPEGEGD